jgi:hypothetical protein
MLPTLIIILLCLMADNFTCHVESTATQWVNIVNIHVVYCMQMTNVLTIPLLLQLMQNIKFSKSDPPIRFLVKEK